MKRPLCTLLALVLGLLCACSPRDLPVEESSASATAASSSSSRAESSSRETAAAVDAEAAAPDEKESPEGDSPEQEDETPAAGYMPPEIEAMIVGYSWDMTCPVPLSELYYLQVPYRDFDGVERTGEIIVRAALAQEVAEIFAELYQADFPIAGLQLIDAFDADDEASMAANNSYAFCSRMIAGTHRFSLHSYGTAIDLNPVQNPYVVGGEVRPEAAQDYLDRGDVRPGMIVEGDACYNAFVSRGWDWGGHWPEPDYQHFEKPMDD